MAQLAQITDGFTGSELEAAFTEAMFLGFERDREPVHVPTQAREVYDVTGAGDTVAGAMAMTLAAGGSLEDACHLASLAAAVVVAKLGTATCDLAELRAAVR